MAKKVLVLLVRLNILPAERFVVKTKLSDDDIHDRLNKEFNRLRQYCLFKKDFGECFQFLGKRFSIEQSNSRTANRRRMYFIAEGAISNDVGAKSIHLIWYATTSTKSNADLVFPVLIVFFTARFIIRFVNQLADFSFESMMPILLEPLLMLVFIAIFRINLLQKIGRLQSRLVAALQ